MDDFTNYFVSFLLSLAVWALGAIVVRVTTNETDAYITWLKIWAVTALGQMFAFSLLLGMLFPSPTMEALRGALTGSGLGL